MSGRAATTGIIPGRYAIRVGKADMPTPPGWVWTLLTDIARLETGHTPSRRHPEYWDDGNIDWIGIKDARLHHGRSIHATIQKVTQLGIDNSAARLLPAGTVCLSRTASVGYVMVMGRDMATSQDFVNWVCSDALLPEFLMYALIAEGEDIRKFGKGTTHTTIYFPEVKAFHLCVPPINEQRRIVAKIEELFSDLNAGVAALKRAKANLKRYRAAVLKGAVEGKLTAEWRAEHPNTEPASKLLRRIPRPPRPARFNSRSVDVISGHAALSVGATESILPSGWAWCPLINIAQMESGHTPSRNHPEWWDGDVPWIGILDAKAHHGGVIHETLQHTNVDGLKNSAARLLPAGTICVSRTAASIGYVVILSKPMATSQDFVNWVPTDAVSSDWLRLVFMVDREVLIRFGKGTTHKTVYYPEWLSMHVAVPPLDEQRQIACEVDQKLTQITVAETQIQNQLTRASRLRQSILKHAFEGKLVPQDSISEPAAELLSRIRQQSRPAVQKVAKLSLSTKRPRIDKENLGRAIAYCLTRRKKPHGRTWLAKVLVLGELHVGVPLNLRPNRFPHGPLDDMIFDAERMAKKAGWFNFEKGTKPKEPTRYEVTSGTDVEAAKFMELLGDRKAAFDNLIKNFDSLDSDRAELFGTVYTAWNDLLIDGRSDDDEAIVAEFYAWDDSKADFTRNQVLNQIAWLRQHDYVPTGKGPRTIVLNQKPNPLAKPAKKPRKA